MKKLLLTLCMLSLCSVVCAQCANDTLKAVGSPAMHTDTIVLGDTSRACMATPCNDLDDCHYWQIDSLVGSLYVFSDTSNLLHVQLLDRCRFVVFDTCRYSEPQTTGSMPISIHGEFPVNSQLVVCGIQPDTVTVLIKVAPVINNFDVIFDLATCHLLTGIEKPTTKKAKRYFDPITLKEAKTRLPNRAYLVR